MFRTITATALALILLVPTMAVGQISKARIDSLRQLAHQEGWTFEIGENEATKRPLSELCGMRPPTSRPENATVMTPMIPTQNLPSSWDWRSQGGVTPIRNQGGCGSCWAFSAVGALECNIRIRDNIIVNISEQHLVSCNLDGYSCADGGWWTHRYHLPESHPGADACECGDHGPVLEEDYPYVGQDTPCDCPHPHATQYCLDDWGFVSAEWTTPTVEQMKEAIMRYGPISVTVTVTPLFQTYDGGIFNACIDEPINHAVVLVGWDDDMGSNGVWIMRNSWGTTWGEDGYMYIEYGCSRIGYNATYVDYGLPEVILWADTTFGPVPLEVNFGALAGYLPVESWAWDFGDGGTSDIQSPTHLFEDRGAFDISVNVLAGGEYYGATRPMYIVVHNDTIRSHDVTGAPGEHVEVTLSTFNSGPVRYFRIPFEFNTGDFSITYDSFSTVGCRTDYFEQQGYLHYDPWFGKRATLKLVSTDDGSVPDLPPGDGPIVKLYFTVSGSATDGQAVPILLDGYDTYVPEFIGEVASYGVATQDFSVTCSEGCCQVRGDANGNGEFDAMDIVFMVEWLWASGPDPSCLDEVEVDGSGEVDPADLVYMVEYAWAGGPAPLPCD